MNNVLTEPLLSGKTVETCLTKQSKALAMENLLQDADYDYSVLSQSEKIDLFESIFD